ncbi:hypothetical protein [Azospirillum brasilense]|uniref:hypothetical protein n=1 Tax=Azospirillum brasilense TaxID=192 RepID=UPI000E6A6AAB|nr:hypothetical protein [Azospirillum brasilense]NUB24694.1 hypothetical protein [Azospirillum brasilense]NUB30403.1 hypothetical protein [Azospirillum brasilense]RIW08310.1 hypothetical protein D2T81_00945 [Azospirillum brasilense]
MKLTSELTLKLAITAADSYHLIYSGSDDLAAVRAAAVDHTLAGIASVFGIGIDIDDRLRAEVESGVDFRFRELEAKRKKRRA